VTDGQTDHAKEKRVAIGGITWTRAISPKTAGFDPELQSWMSIQL